MNYRHSILETFPIVKRKDIAKHGEFRTCLLYTSDAADERSSVDLGGRRIIKKKNKHKTDADGEHRNEKN